MNEKKRDYKKENERQKELNKVYQFKIARYKADLFDTKLKASGTTAKKVFEDAIEKFLKKN